MLTLANILTFTILILWFIINCEEMEPSEIAHREKRQLLYLNSSVLQLNAGIGFPSAVKMINVNYVFQANFQLPWRRNQTPVDIFGANTGYTGTARMKREEGIKDDWKADYQDDAKLCHFYKYVEEVLDGFGYNGKSCVLRTLCQLGAEPLHSDDEEDLLHEMATFLLNPKNDGSNNLAESDESYPYIKAYTDGEHLQDCTKLYQGCSLSFIEVFTKLHDLA